MILPAWAQNSSTAGHPIRPIQGLRQVPCRNRRQRGGSRDRHHGRNHERHHRTPLPPPRHRRQARRRQGGRRVSLQGQSPVRRGPRGDPFHQAKVALQDAELRTASVETHDLQAPPGPGAVPEGVQPAEEGRSVLLQHEEAVRPIRQEPHRDDAAKGGLDEVPDHEHPRGGRRGGREGAEDGRLIICHSKEDWKYYSQIPIIKEMIPVIRKNAEEEISQLRTQNFALRQQFFDQAKMIVKGLDRSIGSGGRKKYRRPRSG